MAHKKAATKKKDPPKKKSKKKDKTTLEKLNTLRKKGILKNGYHGKKYDVPEKAPPKKKKGK